MTPRRRVFTIVSALFLVVTVVLAIASFMVDPWKHSISLGDGFHVTLWHPSDNPSVVFFSDQDYGPYPGSIVGIVGPDGTVYPKRLKEIHFGAIAGIYFRYFQWAPTDVLWTLMVSLLYPLMLFAVLPVAWLLQRFADRDQQKK